MKAILQTLWAVFVLGTTLAVFAIKCEADRLRERQTRGWFSTPRTAGKAEPGAVRSDPVSGLILNGPTLPPLPERPRPAWRDQRPKPAEVAPMPRTKPERAPSPRSR